jgi:PAS domain S-box-containing protein
MNFLHRVVLRPGIFLTIAIPVVLLAMALVASLATSDIEDDLNMPLTKTLGAYAATLEGGTVNSRAMGAALLFGLENKKAKQVALGKLPPNEPEVLAALETIRTLYIADLVYLVNKQGIIVAYASKNNKHGAGTDISFRPYVQLAIQGTANVYPAVGLISPDRGIYLAAPVRAELNNNSRSIGAVVVKVGADKLDALLKTWADGTAVLLSPQGVAFSSSRADWLFQMTGKVSANRIAEIQRSRQFGKVFEPILPHSLPFTLDTPEPEIEGIRHVMRSIPLDWNDPAGDWTLALLERRSPWWAHWNVLGYASLAGLFASLALFWLFSLVRNAVLLKNINNELSTEVTERKWAEQQLNNLLSFNKTILDKSPAGIAVYQGSGSCIMVNEAYAIAIGASVEEVRRQDFRHNVSWQRNGLLNFAKQAIATNSAVRHNIEGTTSFGKRVALECIFSPIDISGTQHLLVITNDISERIEAEHALNESMHQLEEKELAKSRFLAAAGHDLRQPLAAANLFLDALKFTKPTAPQTQIIQRLDQAMINFNELLEALLNISKLDAGVIKPEYISINVTDLIYWLEQSVAPQAAEKNIGFRLYFSMKDSLVVHSDIALVKSVLMNLVSNAIKFTSKGAILVSARRRGSEVLFQVWDTGIGIQTEQIEHIFDEFYQINNPQRDRTSGLGLGLAITKRALTLIGCKINCRSQLGQGSVFGFSLPLDTTFKGIMKQDTRAEEPEDMDNNLFVQGKHFVIVEDDTLVAEAMCKALAMMGSEVINFQSAEDALSHPNIAHADYYIADYMLGGTLNGMEFLNRLHDISGKVPRAVLLTGDTSPIFVRGISDCIWPVLHKPTSISKVLTCLRTQAE